MTSNSRQTDSRNTQIVRTTVPLLYVVLLVQFYCSYNWLRVPECITYKFWSTTVFMACAALPTRCHSACCWSNVTQSTAVCIVIRSCGASNMLFITWRPCGCWTMRTEQFTWVGHWLLVTSHLQGISQDQFENHRSLISIRITSPLKSTSWLISSTTSSSFTSWFITPS